MASVGDMVVALRIDNEQFKGLIAWMLAAQTCFSALADGLRLGVPIDWTIYNKALALMEQQIEPWRVAIMEAREAGKEENQS